MILYKDFTAVIPAAGKGSRFDKNKNKLLYKIKGKTIFENVLDKIKSFSNNIVIIVSKDNLYEINNIASHKKYKQIRFWAHIKNIFKFYEISYFLIRPHKNP